MSCGEDTYRLRITTTVRAGITRGEISPDSYWDYSQSRESREDPLPLEQHSAGHLRSTLRILAKQAGTLLVRIIEWHWRFACVEYLWHYNRVLLCHTPHQHRRHLTLTLTYITLTCYWNIHLLFITDCIQLEIALICGLWRLLTERLLLLGIKRAYSWRIRE